MNGSLDTKNNALKCAADAAAQDMTCVSAQVDNALKCAATDDSATDAAALKRNLALAKQEALLYKTMLEERERRIADLENSSSWKITAPLRFAGRLARIALKSLAAVRYIPKFVGFAREHSFGEAAHQAKHAFKRLIRSGAVLGLMVQVNYEVTPEERRKQEQHAFSKNISFSILTPMYNTIPEYFKELLDSLYAQTYANWQLCLADASDEQSDNGRVSSDMAIAAAEADSRILYKKLECNEGISPNTNAALAMATGDYIVLLDHDDLLHPSALYEFALAIDASAKNGAEADMLYSDEVRFLKTPATAFDPNFKPDFSPDLLRSYNYITHLLVFSRKLQQKVGLFDPECSGSQDYDMALRLSEHASKIVHIPKLLYFWRQNDSSFSAGKKQLVTCMYAAKHALKNHLERLDMPGEIVDLNYMTIYRIRYKIKEEPLVSIIIPNKDHVQDLSKCLDSIYERSTYRNFQILVVENNSEAQETFHYYQTIESKGKARVLVYQGDGGFNFSAINNFAAREAKGDYLLFLNNDIEVVSPDWLQEMLGFAQRKDVAAVGARLLYPDKTVQHAGVVLGINGVAGHAHKGMPVSHTGYMFRLQVAQNFLAVTGACLMVSKDKFWQVNGFDESLAVAFNDVDFCLRLHEAGYVNVFTPYAELFHYESKSRGYEDTPEKKKRFANESRQLRLRWVNLLQDTDPYYNPNLTLFREDFSVQVKEEKK
ncbi:MAG: glycosyltransferase family 2 protein [Coriobacteriales bacterium]|jgi:GT2 family glycosyltransferase|nr:glycosyltransferase family 2 protein [Coriobacteriales bacterium]